MWHMTEKSSNGKTHAADVEYGIVSVSAQNTSDVKGPQVGRAKVESVPNVNTSIAKKDVFDIAMKQPSTPHAGANLSFLVAKS